MRMICLAVAMLSFLVGGPCAVCQQTAPVLSGWARVAALPSGTPIHVHGRTHSASCRVKSVEAEALTCVGKDGAKPETFAKAEIRTIKISHRGRSAAAGAGIGAGAGIILGASTAGSDGLFTRGELASAFAIVFAVIGALVGLATDFTVATIYRG